MALVNRSFSVNITPGMMPPIVHVSEYDVGRAYTVSILDEQGNTFTIPSGTTASIEGTLNGSVGFTQSATISNNQVSFTLSESMTAYSGKAWCKIKLTLNSEPIQTCAFVLAVDRAGVEAETVIGAPGFEGQIQDAVNDYLEDHPVGVEVDPTLTISGAAADAKATGDEISGVKSALEYKTSDITRKLEYVRGENLCRGNDTVTLGYMGMDGRIYTAQTLVYTEKIPVNVGEVIRAYCAVDGTFAQRVLRFVTAFDASGNVMAASGADNKWSYTVPDGVSEIIISTTLGTNYMVAVGAVKTTYVPYGGYYKATDDFIGDILTNRLGEKVDKDGIEQVKTANIEGMTEAGAGISSNLFPKATIVANGKYVAGISGSTGKAYLTDAAGYDTYIIPVDGESVYAFTNCRTAILVSDLDYTPIGELLSYATTIDSAGGKYILFSFSPTTYPVNSYSVTKPVTKYTIPSNWIIPDEGDLKKPIDSANGLGTLNIVGRSALKDGELITFKGFFDTFAEFSLNFTSTSTSTITNYIKVDATNITIKNTTTTPTPQAHGLTIQNDVTLTARFIDGTMKITLYSSGESWSSTVNWNQTNGTVSQPQIAPNEMTFTDAMLRVSYDAVKRSIWYFGDSYIGITSPDRWVYYLKEDGFSGNALINGSAGSTSNGASTALSALIKYGTPKFAVMATGMNDGSDTDGNPTNLWINSRDAFITACQNNGIEPIFATIPTVPTVNNEAKNAWVKSSGYRYIDFAKAVGADGMGAWYSGMLSGDNVHPTAKGAKALYTQVLIDLPEITISK